MTDPASNDTEVRRSRTRLPWHRPRPPALTGTLVLLRLLPTVSLPLTILLALAVLVSAALPIAVTVVSGLLVGAIPAAVRSGLASPPGSASSPSSLPPPSLSWSCASLAPFARPWPASSPVLSIASSRSG